MSYSVDGYQLASASYDGLLHISDTVNLDEIKIVKTLQHEDKVVSVKWHPYLPLLGGLLLAGRESLVPIGGPCIEVTDFALRKLN